MNSPALTPPSVIMKRICPFDVMAGIKLKPKRAPVPVATIGVSPTLPRSARVMIRAHVRGVGKENQGVFPLRERLDPRIFRA